MGEGVVRNTRWRTEEEASEAASCVCHGNRCREARRRTGADVRSRAAIGRRRAGIIRLLFRHSLFLCPRASTCAAAGGAVAPRTPPARESRENGAGDGWRKEWDFWTRVSSASSPSLLFLFSQRAGRMAGETRAAWLKADAALLAGQCIRTQSLRRATGVSACEPHLRRFRSRRLRMEAVLCGCTRASRVVG